MGSRRGGGGVSLWFPGTGIDSGCCLVGLVGWLIGCVVEVVRNEDMFLFSSCLFVCLFVRSFLACRQDEEINDNVGFIYYGWILGLRMELR